MRLVIQKNGLGKHRIVDRDNEDAVYKNLEFETFASAENEKGVYDSTAEAELEELKTAWEDVE